MVMVKPGMPYLIVRRVKDTFAMPTFNTGVRRIRDDRGRRAQRLDRRRSRDDDPARLQARRRDGILTYFAPRAEKIKAQR